MLWLLTTALALHAAAAPQKSKHHSHLFVELACGPRDPSVDCEALVQLHHAVGLAGWCTGESYCGWPGVLCGDDGRVVALSLRSNDLQINIKKKSEAGKGKSDVGVLGRARKLRKEIPKQHLARLKQAAAPEQEEDGEIVDRFVRQCARRPVFPHAALSKLERLEVLSLVGLNMTGKAPAASLNLLRALRELHLAENSLSGPLPELDQLTKLEALHLDGNGFQGALGSLLRSLARAPLRRLGLARNALTGHLPGNALEKLRALEALRLGGNSLDGPFPSSSLAKLAKLTNVSVWGNRFEGDASVFLKDASISLATFDATGNKLRGDLQDTPSRIQLEALRLGGNLLEGALPKPSNIREVASLQLWSEVSGRTNTPECDLEPTCGGASAASLALSRSLDDANLWLGGDVRPWRKLLQDDERKGGPPRRKEKDGEKDIMKDMRRERDQREARLSRAGAGVRKLKDFRRKLDTDKKNNKNVVEAMYSLRRNAVTEQVADHVEAVDAAEKAELDATEAAHRAARDAELKAKIDEDNALKAKRDADVAAEKASRVEEAKDEKSRRKAEDAADAAKRLSKAGERRRRGAQRDDDHSERMAKVQEGVERARKVADEARSHSRSDAERSDYGVDVPAGAARARQMADKRAEIDAGIEKVRMRRSAARERYAEPGRRGADVEDARPATRKFRAPETAAAPSEEPRAAADAPAADGEAATVAEPEAVDASGAAVEAPDEASEVDDAPAAEDAAATTVEAPEVVADSSAVGAQAQEHAWEEAFARAEAAEAREKARAAGAPVVAAAIKTGIAADKADKASRLEEIRARARENVRLASQGGEF